VKPISLTLTGIALSLCMLAGVACTSGGNQTTTSHTDHGTTGTPSPSPQVIATPGIQPANHPEPAVSAKAGLSTAPPTKETAATKEGSSAQIKHIVIVVEENHSYKQIVEGSDSPYIHSLIQRGALFTDAHGITHPSQPNYLALFSGSAQGVKDDSCHKPFTAANLASELANAKLTFTGYSEDLPKVGYTGCSSKGYARKHNPWVQFSNVPEDSNRPFTDFPKDFSQLPTVSFVIPNHQSDMHDGTVKQADDWLKNNLEAYVTWAEKNNSLLIVTWDEDDFAKANHIPLIFVGPTVKPGKYGENVNHYHVLRTIEDRYNLSALGESKNVKPITSIWR
jgi:phospholipase C